MHRPSLAKLLFFILFLMAGAGCTKHADGITGPAGPVGPAGADGASAKASPITGYIQLNDPYGDPYPSSPGVTLSVKKGDSLLTATTDSTGKFSTPPLPPGNYNIHVTKTGYDSLEIFVQHSGGNEAKFIGITNLAQTLTARISGQSLSLSATDLVLTTTFSDQLTGAVNRQLYFFFSHSKTVTSTNSDWAIASGQNNSQNQFVEDLLLSNLTQNSSKPFHSGDSVFVKTIIEPSFYINSFYYTYYYDYTNDRSVRYPYPGDSAITSFKMP